MLEPAFVKYLSVQRKYRQSSIDSVGKKLLFYFAWCQKNGKDILSNFDDFLFEKQGEGLVNNALNTYVTAYNVYLDYLVFTGKEAPKHYDSFDKNKKEIFPLSIEEIDDLIATEVKTGLFRGKDANVLNRRYSILIRFLASTGCRINEAFSLKVGHCNLPYGYVSFLDTKNRDNRKAYLSQPLLGQLKELTLSKKQEDFVFTNMVNGKMRNPDFAKDLKKRAKLIGITKNVHPHLFRHSFATELRRRGVSIADIATLLGHKDIQTTFDTYAHAFDDSLRKAALHHPLLSKGTDPKELVTIWIEFIKAFQIEFDPRFDRKKVMEAFELFWESIKVDQN